MYYTLQTMQYIILFTLQTLRGLYVREDNN